MWETSLWGRLQLLRDSLRILFKTKEMYVFDKSANNWNRFCFQKCNPWPKDDETSALGYCGSVEIQKFNPQLYQRLPSSPNYLRYHQLIILWKYTQVDWLRKGKQRRLGPHYCFREQIRFKRIKANLAWRR